MKRKIVLDAGHGEGKAFNRGSIIGNEGDNNFKMANILKDELEKKGFEVTLTRNKSSDNPTLAERGKAGKGHDLLLSLHTNAGGGSGIEIWDDVNPKYSNKALAESICEEVSKLLNIKNRGVKYRRTEKGNNYYGVLANGQANSNMIIEWVFHDNRDEVQKYVEKMKEIAAVTAKVIAEHYNVTEAKPIKTANNAKSKYYEKSKLKIIETTADNIYLQAIPGVPLHNIGAYGMSGTFQDTGKAERTESIWSIAVNAGKPLGPNAHTNSIKGYKRGTMICYADGSVEVLRINELKEVKKPIKWAIGGGSLSPFYNPPDEGFVAPYDDVLRNAYHAGIAHKGNKIFLIVSSPCTMGEFRSLVENSLSIDGAVFLDGGGTTQMYYKNGKGLKQFRKLSHMIGLSEV